MMDSKIIPKYQTELTIPPVFMPTQKYDKFYKCCVPTYEVDMVEAEVQMLPACFPKTKVYAYAGMVYAENNCCGEYRASVPGPTFMEEAGQAISVIWNNRIKGKHLFAIDPTLHWANPNGMVTPEYPFQPYPEGYLLAQEPVPTVVHLHGGETESKYDGFPDSWFTHNGKNGPMYETNEYKYLNQQQSSTLFYHDHTLGITRLNVYAGLSGAYLISDPYNYLDNIDCTPLPSGKFDIPLMVQDKSFDEDGNLSFSAEGDVPDVHPYWRRFFYGNTIVVNGKVWPKLDVEQTAYRFRIINASNSRFYKFKLSNCQPIIQIGTDGGYLERPVYLDELYLAPAERADVIIDFSGACLNDDICLLNVNYEDGQTNPDTTGQVMLFKVMSPSCQKPLCLPRRLNEIPKLCENISKRVVTLNSLNCNDDVLALLLNGKVFAANTTEYSVVGSIQVWEVVNLANGPHPIHIHLADSRLVNRQKIDVDSYRHDWEQINGPMPIAGHIKEINPDSYCTEEPLEPPENENGWKDTIVCPPGYVTRIMLAMYPSILDPSKIKPGKNRFPFDPSTLPGYVWHCHMLDHEDNEMMRPMKVVLQPPNSSCTN